MEWTGRMNSTVLTILNLIFSILRQVEITKILLSAFVKDYGGLVVLTIHQRVVERGEE
jgi:hypothetical protein